MKATPDPCVAWHAVERLALTGTRGDRRLARQVAGLLRSPAMRQAMTDGALASESPVRLALAEQAAERAFRSGASELHVEKRGRWEVAKEVFGEGPKASPSKWHVRHWCRNKAQRKLVFLDVRRDEKADVLYEAGSWTPATEAPSSLVWERIDADDLPPGAAWARPES